MANDESVRGKTVEEARIEARDSGRWPSSKGEGSAVESRTEKEKGEQADG